MKGLNWIFETYNKNTKTHKPSQVLRNNPV